MYLEYFSLQRHPFRITPDPALFFPGGAQGRGVVLQALIYGVMSGEGILKVVGEVGSGKTMLCRMLEERLPDSVEIVYLANPNLSPRDIIYAIAFELKLDVDSSTERLVVMHRLQDYLLKRHGEGAIVVVFIEEAQSMPLETLEEIRLLTNLETHRHKLMQIVLFGQPELDRKLQKKSIRQLRERITHSFNLQPLSVDATRGYLRFRLQAAGCPKPQIFSPSAERILAKAASGLTRRINILADKSLLAAYADAPGMRESHSGVSENQYLVLPRHVKAAIRDSGYRKSGNAYFRYGGVGFAAVLVVTVLLGFFNKTFLTDSEIILEPDSAPGNMQSTSITSTTGSQMPESGSAGNAIFENSSLAPVEFSQRPAVLIEEVADDEEEFKALQLALNEPPILEDENESENNISEDDDVESGTESLNRFMIAVVDDAESSVSDSENPAARELAVQVQSPDGDDTSEDISIVLNEVDRADEVALEGLVSLRSRETREWLDQLSGKSGYTVQFFTAPTSNMTGLEEFLQFLQLLSLLQNTHVCFISETTEQSASWLVIYGEFPGVSVARNFISGLPEYIRQYGPFVRNLNSIACNLEGPAPAGAQG